MVTNNDHNNWITVGEVVRLLKDPIALYTSHIVNKFHAELSSRLPSARCTISGACEKKRKHDKLCVTCRRWYDELAKSHKNKDRSKIKWRENCVTSNWPSDPWEVAKFFMPPLGDNKITTKDAESTDLSSLLNVLAWMEDAVFNPGRRLDHKVVKKFCSEVRNRWAHEPGQKFSEDALKNAFHMAKNLISDLDKVFGCNEVNKCLEDIVLLEKNGLTNVAESERQILSLLAVELGANVRTLEKKVEALEVLVSNKGNDGLKSCIPDKPPIFIGRDTKREEIICSIVENDCGIVSIVGGPGFGKSSLAVEVSHDLRNKHDIVVIFSYLSNSSTVSDVIQRLCNDVGVNSGEEPEKSLMFFLKSIENKVVLVMDNIEQLLEGDVKSQFIELMLTLRKNSRQYLQILTTSRIEFSIPYQATQNHKILELDKKSSVELLKQCCLNEKVSDEYLSELADLCGCVPIALCIAGTLFQSLDDPWDLVEWLREKPLETLDNSDLCVKKAIEFSFKRLSREDQKAFVCLFGFDGNFERKSAEEVIQRNGFETHKFLQNLVTRSLLQRSSDKRFVIHSLIRRFLADCDQFQDEKATAQGLMVAHFLKRCHSLTMSSYSKCNEFANARKEFRKDVHNVVETLKICSQIQATHPKPNILNSLVCSDIYNSSSRFFFDFSWDLLPLKVLRNFIDSCIQVAESRNEPVIQIAFQNQAAGQDARKFGWKSSIYLSRMKLIQEILRKIDTPLKEDRLLLMHSYNFYAHYDCNDIEENPLLDLAEKDVQPLSDIEYLSPIEKATELQILNQRGYMHKRYSSRIFRTDKEKSQRHTMYAISYFTQALSTAEMYLGDHELTCTIQKKLGDVYFTWHGNEAALSYYSEAIQLRMKLELDSNEKFVLLLKNCGSCLSYLGRHEEAVQMLKKAVDIADKLDEKHTVFRARLRYQLARAYRNWSPYFCQDAALFAKEAMEMQDLLNMHEVRELIGMIERAEKGKP